MKRLQRTILGIIRRPLKSLILLMVVFVLGNVISGSLILYNTSQSIKDEVMNQSTPIIRIKTPIDIGYALNLSEEFDNPYDEVERMNFIQKQDKAYEEIFNLLEVKYADWGLYNCWNISNKKMEEKSFKYAPEHKAAHVIGINQPDFFHLNDHQIKIVEGRNFTQEEIDQGESVIVVSRYLMKYIHEKYNRQYNVGEKITLENKAYQTIADVYYLDVFREDQEIYDCYYEDDCVYTPEQMQRIKQEIQDALVIDEKLELTIIGIYDIVDYNKYYNKKNPYIYEFSPLIYMPIKLHQEYKFDFINKIKAYNQKYSVDLYSDDLKSKNMKSMILLNDSNDIPLFKEKANDILKKYGLEEYKLDVNLDTYLQVAGQIITLEEISQYLIVVSIIVALIILSVVSLLFLKERKKEMAILLSLGEYKKNVILQMFCELFIIGVIGIGCSMITVRQFSTSLSDRIFNSYHPVELTQAQIDVLPDNLSPKAILSHYETQLAGADITSVMGVSGLILIVSSGCSLFVLLKTKPKDLLN